MTMTPGQLTAGLENFGSRWKPLQVNIARGERDTQITFVSNTSFRPVKSITNNLEIEQWQTCDCNDASNKPMEKRENGTLTGLKDEGEKR